MVSTLAAVEDRFHTAETEKRDLREKTYRAIAQRQIAFGSPLLANIGRGHSPSSSCTLIPVDLRKSIEEVKKVITPYFQAGMGSGFDLSDVEDPVGTLRELNKTLLEIEEPHKRPPCGMALLMVDHPRVLEFVTMKREDDFSRWRFNLSVGITDAFMHAVQEDQEWTFKNGEKRSAKEIFQAIVDSAHYCGEPGMVFMDSFKKDNPVPSLEYKSVAPCAEIAMAPGEVCQFSYLNLAEMVQKQKGGSLTFDFETLKQTTTLLTQLLDNGVELSIENAVAVTP